MTTTKFYKLETDEGEEIVYVPSGNPEEVESGVLVTLINDLPSLIEILNKEYSTSLLHYQDESKIDIQKLLVRVVRKYLNKEII